ncbi:SDR family oxidoreductase [Mucilaginibacter calamicampi]|uniref:SDR family oxidoreductase n=1 Tax=Mucilaginibacter calamicampi TaxID=1302352 RepID=UPI00367195FA
MKKKVLITGASRGLGLAISKILANDYHLILHATTPESFTETIPGSDILCADLSDAEQLTEFCKQLKKQHGSDLYGVINNAGVTFDTSIIYQQEKNIDAMLNINLRAPIMICKTVMKLFSVNGGGVIINMSSVVGESGNAFQAVYAATKAGLVAFSKSLAQEAAAFGEDHNIRVLCVSPGFIDTDMTANIPAEMKEKYLNMIPAKRLGKPDDVAQTICFLLSEKASYINGTNIHINGGLF